MIDFKFIDCHNHSLPFLDDGAEDMEMAIAMLKAAQENGTSDVILTPHHLNGAFSNEAGDVLRHIDALQKESINRNIDIRLHAGSEVHLVTETAKQITSKKALTYCGLGKAALIELPKNSIPNGIERILSELIFHGISPLIAHPERNSTLRKDQTPLKEWIEFGCKSQLTGQSCTGDFGVRLQEISFSMIEQGLVHLVASDAHRPTGRDPDLSKAAKVLTTTFGAEVAKQLLCDNPKRLIHGKELKAVRIDNTPSITRPIAKKDQKKKKGKRSKSILQRLIDFK